MKTIALSLALLFATATHAAADDSADEIRGEIIPVECWPEWKVTNAGPNLILTCPATHITIICPKIHAKGKTRAQLRRGK